MKPECRNDCIEKLLFPKTLENRPGLSHIDYRIGSYPDILEALMRQLDNAPLLSAWTHRKPDDPGIALLEGAAVLGDILTFYQELYANEAYLRTAQWRESIADLVRLTGYLLSHGVGGKANFALEVKEDKDKLNHPVTIPKGFPINAQVEGLEQAADFETAAAVEAVPALSQFSLYRPAYHPDITTGTTVFSVTASQLEQMELEIKAGDRLMLVDNPADAQSKRQMVVVADVEPRFDRIEIIIEGQWQQGFVGPAVTAYKIGRTFRYLGYNSTNTTIAVENGLAVEKPVSFSRQLAETPGVITGYLAGVYYPLPNYYSFPLDQEVEDISTGATFLVDLQLSSDPSGIGNVHIFERTVTQVSAATVTIGSITSGATVIQLNDYAALPLAVPPRIYSDIRTMEFHEVKGRGFTVKNAITPIQSADGSALFYYGDADSYKKLDHRTIALAADSRVETPVVTVPGSYWTVVARDRSRLRPLFLSPALQSFNTGEFPLEDPDVTVYGNLVAADQGKSEKEVVLGNGDNRKQFQDFKLPKKPLTYHIQAGETPPEVPELEIYVNDRLWTQVPSFFGKGPDEQVYIVRQDAEDNSWVQFGDGKTGARLPSGIGNVKAVYRTGTGAYGELKEGTKPQPGGKADRLDKIFMPLPSSGGSEPESGDNAQQAAPGKTQALGRLVSLKDFESEALAIPGVSRASAAWEVSDDHSAVVVTLLMESGRSGEFEDVRDTLSSYNICRGPQRFPVVVIQAKRSYVYIQAEFALDASYREDNVKAAIQEALGVTGQEDNGIDGTAGLFGADQRQLGQNAYASRIEGTIKNVDGVIWAKVSGLLELGEADEPAQLTAPATPTLSPVLSCDNRHLFCLYDSHLQLSAVKEETTGRC